MANEIYITKSLAAALDSLPEQQREEAASLIDSLAGNGLKKSEIVAADDSQGGGLRALFSGNLSLIFRYTPEQHSILVTNVSTLESKPLVAA